MLLERVSDHEAYTRDMVRSKVAEHDTAKTKRGHRAECYRAKMPSKVAEHDAAKSQTRPPSKKDAAAKRRRGEVEIWTAARQQLPRDNSFAPSNDSTDQTDNRPAAAVRPPDDKRHFFVHFIFVWPRPPSPAGTKTAGTDKPTGQERRPLRFRVRSGDPAP